MLQPQAGLLKCRKTITRFTCVAINFGKFNRVVYDPWPR